MVSNKRSTPSASLGGKNSKEKRGFLPKRSTIFIAGRELSRSRDHPPRGVRPARGAGATAETRGNFASSMRIHVIAVAGTGRGALAGLLAELGHEVRGSDIAFDPPIGPELSHWGVRCLEGFDAAHL